MDPHSFEASPGPCHDVRVLLPNKTIVLKHIFSCDLHGVDFIVKQTKENLLSHDDVKAQVTDPKKVTLVLTKGKESIVMKDNVKTIDYLSKITADFTLEIRVK